MGSGITDELNCYSLNRRADCHVDVIVWVSLILILQMDRSLARTGGLSCNTDLTERQNMILIKRKGFDNDTLEGLTMA
jgi:hypothetical protein